VPRRWPPFCLRALTWPSTFVAENGKRSIATASHEPHAIEDPTMTAPFERHAPVTPSRDEEASLDERARDGGLSTIRARQLLAEIGPNRLVPDKATSSFIA